jgi:hypothetical protein
VPATVRATLVRAHGADPPETRGRALDARSLLRGPTL